MNLWKKLLYKEYKKYRKKHDLNIDDWFKYSGLIEHDNKIKFKKIVYAKKFLNQTLIKNNMDKYKLKKYKNAK